MRNNTFIILSIIFTIISLIYIILCYYGITRYISIITYLSNIDTLAKDYHLMEKSNKKYRVVISMCVNDMNLDKIKPSLMSIIDQTVKVDEISINIPQKICGGPDGNNIPEYLKKYSNTYNILTDYGDCNIVIPTLIREKDKDTIIIFLTPDYIYGQNFISEFVDKYIETINKKLLSDKNIGVLIYKNDNNNIISCPMITQLGSFNINYDNIKNNNNFKTSDFILKNLKKNIYMKEFTYKENYKYL